MRHIRTFGGGLKTKGLLIEKNMIYPFQRWIECQFRQALILHPLNK